MYLSCSKVLKEEYILYFYVNNNKPKRRMDLSFENKRFATKGVAEQVSPLLQIFMWRCIDDMPAPKDYLQVFKLSIEDGKQKVIHIQEQPEYKAEYLFSIDTPLFVGKIYVIDDETYSTMLLAEEY